jgi:hypothetical protein
VRANSIKAGSRGLHQQAGYIDANGSCHHLGLRLATEGQTIILTDRRAVHLRATQRAVRCNRLLCRPLLPILK